MKWIKLKGIFMKKNRFIIFISVLILLIFIFVFVLIIVHNAIKVDRKTEKTVIQSSSSYFSSSLVSSVEEPFGRAINIKGKKAVVIRKNKEEIIEDKKTIFPESFLIVEDTGVVVSNRDSVITLNSGSKVYVGKESITPSTGETKVEGKINLRVFSYKIYGNGEIVIRVKENEVHIAQYRGYSKIKTITNTIELKEREGIILYRNNEFEPPFKIPASPEEIKVKIY